MGLKEILGVPLGGSWDHLRSVVLGRPKGDSSIPLGS